jgi:uncharacterized protein
MNGYEFSLNRVPMVALANGALWLPLARLLVVSDLHLGKAARVARNSGMMLPPYEVRDTMTKLDNTINSLRAAHVVCLGDSFDDLQAGVDLPESEKLWLTRLQAGRHWIWVEGNHDPGPLDLGGVHLAQHFHAGLTFRHIAKVGAIGEISGHYHPKATLQTRASAYTAACFLIDKDKVIMPAFGAYTGGLHSQDRALTDLMKGDALAVLTGRTALPIPMPRVRAP